MWRNNEKYFLFVYLHAHFTHSCLVKSSRLYRESESVWPRALPLQGRVVLYRLLCPVLTVKDLSVVAAVVPLFMEVSCSFMEPPCGCELSMCRKVL